MSPIGREIDGLFYLILGIVTLTFIGTQYTLGWVLWKGATADDGQKARFSHGSHSLELIWTIVPGVILVFIALYQMDVWARFRVQDRFPQEARSTPLVEVTARQFEWRFRYPAPGKTLQNTPQPDDLYTVNEMHVPAGRPVLFSLRSGDLQHSFFAPQLRIKQDAVPDRLIPVWVEIPAPGEYELLCAELCGWGHYKMRAIIHADPQYVFDEYLVRLQEEQNFDGVVPEADEDDE